MMPGYADGDPPPVLFVPKAGERFRVLAIKTYPNNRESVVVGEELTAGEDCGCWAACQERAPGFTVVKRDGRLSVARLAPVPARAAHAESPNHCAHGICLLDVCVDCERGAKAHLDATETAPA